MVSCRLHPAHSVNICWSGVGSVTTPSSSHPSMMSPCLVSQLPPLFAALFPRLFPSAEPEPWMTRLYSCLPPNRGSANSSGCSTAQYPQPTRCPLPHLLSPTPIYVLQDLSHCPSAWPFHLSSRLFPDCTWHCPVISSDPSFKVGCLLSFAGSWSTLLVHCRPTLSN